jgi:hypothetical protein
VCALSERTKVLTSESKNVEAVEIHPPAAVGQTLLPNISEQMVSAVITQSIGANAVRCAIGLSRLLENGTHMLQ